MQIHNATQLNAVIFKDKAAAPFGKKFVSLFPGLGYAAGYKVRPSLTNEQSNEEKSNALIRLLRNRFSREYTSTVASLWRATI